MNWSVVAPYPYHVSLIPCRLQELWDGRYTAVSQLPLTVSWKTLLRLAHQAVCVLAYRSFPGFEEEREKERKRKIQAVLPQQWDEQPWKRRGRPKPEDKETGRVKRDKHTWTYTNTCPSFHHFLLCCALRLAKVWRYGVTLAWSKTLSKHTLTLVFELLCTIQHHGAK